MQLDQALPDGGGKAFKVNPQHLAKLRTCAKPAIWSGSRPLSWANWVGGRTVAPYRNYLSDTCPTRSALTALCGKPSVPIEAAFLSIMAWGGMHRLHGRRAWRARNDGLLETMSWIKAAQPSRLASYRAFQQLACGGNLPGIGPAYFTKLIFFLNPHSHAYIMDQWTAKSINLLFGAFIRLNLGVDRGRDSVPKNTSADVYETFCRSIDELVNLIPCSDGSEAERLIFSQSRPTPQHWRYYLKQSWDPGNDNAK